MLKVQHCPRCRNDKLVIRTDVYQDARQFVFCDGCGAMAEVELWNAMLPLKSNLKSLMEAVTRWSTEKLTVEIKAGGWVIREGSHAPISMEVDTLRHLLADFRGE